MGEGVPQERHLTGPLPEERHVVLKGLLEQKGEPPGVAAAHLLQLPVGVEDLIGSRVRLLLREDPEEPIAAGEGAIALVKPLLLGRAGPL